MMKCRMSVECESVLAWLRSALRSIGLPAMHDTSLCGLVRVPDSYDGYTALVKSGEVTSVHVRRIGSGMYLWWTLDTV